MIPQQATGRLIVKFHDEIRARVVDDGVTRSDANYDIRSFKKILGRYGLSARPALSPSPQRLAAIEARAAAYSGQAQPDLAGVLYVQGQNGVPLAAAGALNNLDYVEFVSYEPRMIAKQTGACCQMGANGICVEDVTAVECSALPGGVFLGDGTTCGGPNCGVCCLTTEACIVVSPDFCANVPPPDGPGVFVDGELDCATFDCSELDEPDCGVAGTGSCLDPFNGSPYCDNEQCCIVVCEIDPFCCDDSGDVIWPNRDFTGVGHWDPWCADHALELCAGVFNGGALPPAPSYDPNAQTPSFTDAQGYYDTNPWTSPPPESIGRALRYDASGWPSLLDGYSGEGFDLQAIWNVGEILIDSGIANQNLTRGKTIKVGVVEHAAFIYAPNNRGALGLDRPYKHEDLHGKVIVEPDPDYAFIIIDGSLDQTGNHGTATLGIIGAIDQNAAGDPVSGQSPWESTAEEVGMVGMAPDADLYFFSTATVSGTGTMDAIVRALDAGFGPGDVLSFSIGPGGCGTLNNDLGAASMIQVATASGVTCCIAAGNDCCNLETSGTSIESGAIVVGAVFPGAGPVYNQYCRLPFSNYCQACTGDPTTWIGQEVHTSAWGTSVATLGGGSLFVGTDANTKNRSYQNDFGGTSAAAPQVAAAVACLQGLAKMMWDIPLSPATMRGLVSGNGALQCRLSADNIPGSTPIDFLDCSEATAIMSHGDWNMNETSNLVATNNVAFTNTFLVAEEVIAGSFFGGNQLVDDIQILVGQKIHGNVFSIKALDGNYLVISSELTTPGGSSVSKRGDIISGYVTDVLIRSHVEFDNVDNMTVAADSFVTGGAGVMLLYIYSWEFNRWLVGGIDILDGDTAVFPVGNAGQFIQNGTRKVLFRIQTVSSAFGPTYEAWHDRIGLFAGGNPQVPSDGD